MSAPATPTVEAPLSIAEYEAMVDQLQPLSAEEAAQADAIIQAQAQAQFAAPPPAAAPVVAEEQAQEAAEPETGQPRELQLSNNWRLDAGGDPLTQLTFQIYKQHQGGPERLLLSVAEAMARQQLGMQPVTAAAAPPAEEQEPVEQADSPIDSAVTALMGQLETLNTERAAAINDFDPAKQAEVQQKIDDLNRQIIKEELRAEMEGSIAAQKAAELSAAHEASLAASRAAVAAQYGDHYQAGSPLTLMMMGLFDLWQSSDDARMNDPRLPELIAQEAASKLGIQPKNEQNAAAHATGATTVKQSLAPQAQPRSTQPVAPPIAPGTARSQDPGPIQTPNFSSTAEYEAWVQANLGFSAL